MAHLWSALVMVAALAAAPDELRISAGHRAWKSKGGVCDFDITYPEVTGPGARVAAQIDREISRVFLDEKRFAEDCHAEEGADHIRIEASFSVGLEEAGYLSVRYSGLQYAVDPDGQPAGAHPTKLQRGLTLSLRDGKAISWRALFRSNAMARVEEKLSHQVADVDIKADRDFFLTRSSVVVMNLFDNFAAGGIQASLRHRDLTALANPGGPLPALAALPELEDWSGVYPTPDGKVVVLMADDAATLAIASSSGVCNQVVQPSSRQSWRSQSQPPQDRIDVDEASIHLSIHCNGPVELTLVRPPAEAPRTCTVKATRAAFSDPETGVERSAYVVEGDTVETAPFSEPGKWLARFRSRGGHTLGLLEASALDCP